jgi:hypothetical protein
LHNPPTPGPEFDEEACHDDGERVYEHTTDADRPSGCSVSWIAYWDGRYWALGDSIDPSGPYMSVEEAVNISGISELTRDVAHRIVCRALTSAAILRLITDSQPEGADAEGACVELNGETYVLAKGGEFRNQ